MFCEKCGSQLPDDAKFCENCGSSTEPGAENGPGVAAAVPAAPSAFALAVKKFFSNKRNVAVAAAALILVIAAIVAVIIIASQPEKIYIDDYFDVEFSGVDGYGNAYFTSTSEQNEKLEKLNKKLFPDGEHNIQYFVKISLDISDDEEGSLKNGDKVKVKLDVGELYKYLDGYEVVLRNKTVKVKGLIKHEEVNILDYVKPIITGYSGYGKNNSDAIEDIALLNGVKVNVSCSYNRLYIEFRTAEENNYITEVRAVLDKYEELSNGDVITVTFDPDDFSTGNLFNGYGITLVAQTKTYTVSGLEEPKKLDVASQIKCGFSGYSTVADMTVAIVNESVALGDYTVAFTSTSASGFVLQIKDSNGNSVREYQYSANKHVDLSNGDVITFSTYTNVNYALEDCGIELPKSFDITVEGLKEPFKPDPVGRGTYSFSGYNNYATFNFSLPEDKCVYKSEDGKYTVKLTFKTEGSYYVINVVVADETDKNFISFNYEAYKGGTLKNGNTVIFYSDAWQSTLQEYVEEYGIYFEDNVKITVDGLKDATPVDLLDNVTYSFAKDEDKVRMTLGLKEASVTLEKGTVDLSLETYTSWGTEYTKLIFTVKDENGAECGSGYYYIKIANLTEGQKVSFSYSCGDVAKIVNAAGIIFESDNTSVIVSSK